LLSSYSICSEASDIFGDGLCKYNLPKKPLTADITPPIEAVAIDIMWTSYPAAKQLMKN
jgi:hypothetical protein